MNQCFQITACKRCKLCAFTSAIIGREIPLRQSYSDEPSSDITETHAVNDRHETKRGREIENRSEIGKQIHEMSTPFDVIQTDAIFRLDIVTRRCIVHFCQLSWRCRALENG